MFENELCVKFIFIGKVWFLAQIFLCLWHVRKTWVENAVKKNNEKVERAIILQRIGLVMYGKGCLINFDPVLWTHKQLYDIQHNYLKVMIFLKYMYEV